MEKARDIWRNKIRTARKPILEELDIKYIRTLEENGDVKPIVETKKKLRDFPNKPEIENASSVEELKKIWDNDLLGDK
jgi:hypothetical protein|tara:strand:+ start:410 stop:643 length:234 start_codon:yes stop_codon:yes gene_type:complete